MRIERITLLSLAFLTAYVLTPITPLKAVGATVEVEEDEGEVDAAPTPAPAKPKAAEAAAKPQTKTAVEVPTRVEPVKPQPTVAVSAPVVVKRVSKMARVRISDKIGFYYFVKSGFVVTDSSKVPIAGTVMGSFEKQISYSAPKKTYIELKENIVVKPGDLLVVYHMVDKVRESHTGFEGFWVRNLGIVKVLEVDKRRCMVEVKKSFFPFEDGDKVKFYEDELKRWKQAQVKKALPDHPMSAYVAAGTKGSDYLSQADFIILTAGSKQGVVEGQKFKLRELKDLGIMEDPLHLDRGVAQVFYAGPDCSMAQIHFSNLPVEKGFEAIYKP